MSSLSSPDFFPQLTFWAVVGLTLGGAIFAVFPLNILYNVLGMAVALAGVAGLYFFLGSPFIGLMQILIYVGAICVAIIFAIMLSRPLHIVVPKREPMKVALGVLAAVLFFAGNLGMIFKTEWTAAIERSQDWSASTVGLLLLTRYDLVFELISLVLLVAIIGAILTAGYSRRLSQ
jgi:NADH-quinone oxidoreductase subunit J